MVYQNKVALAIKCGGKVLRENNETVVLPFGAEYSIFLKNLNSCRILAKVEVDGKDATEGTQLIVQPNSSLDLQRYIRNGNFTEGNAFRFVERTTEVEGSRGIKVDDGIVRVEFQVERVTVNEDVHVNRRYHYHDEYPWYPAWPPRPRPIYPNNSYYPWGDFYWTYTQAGATSSHPRMSASLGCQSSTAGTQQTQQQVFTASMNAMTNDAGITVPGSRNEQRFVAGGWFPVHDARHALVLHLKGEVGGRPVEVPLTVKTDLTCSVCYKTWPGTQQFCGGCGAALVLL